MKIFQASKSLAALTKQFTAAGLNIDDFINAADETALQAHLDTLKVVDPKAASALASAQGLVGAFKSALTKFGAKIEIKEGESFETIETNIVTACDARASIKAADQLAKHGLPSALKLAPSGDATQPKVKAVANTDADKLAHYESLPAGSKERREYGAKHYDAINRANSTRMLHGE